MSDQPRKALIFSLAYFPNHISGAEMAVKEITDRISPSEFEFDLITLRFDSTLPKTEKIGNVQVYRVGWGKKGATTDQTFTFLFYISKILFVPLAVLKALSLNRKHRYDFFWALMAYMLYPIVLMRMVGNRTPYFVNLQEGDPFEWVFGRWYMLPFKPLLRYGFRHASSVQVLSAFLGVWAQQMGFKGEPVVIPNAVNTKHFSQQYPSQELNELKTKLGKIEGDVFLITTSRLVKKNALGDVIEALSFLPDRVKFVILGIGPDESMLQKLAVENNVEERVLFLGQIDHAEMPKYLQISDAFVRPSLSEGMGSSFVEAMASSVPVIATQEGGISDFLFDAERNPDKEPTGWAVDTRNPEQIARAVNLILDNKATTQKTVENAKKMAFEKYDWDIIARDVQGKVFSNMLS